ncbi:hypothetical protein MAR_028504 [Mya arenaria]|uniref:Uncharacterized protein n=1 Tax=Mya arenaria TaxID=6604 RepID=A0ABY7DEX4_MYAAR|nr:hypothetical protein MAR_028489 [Mya arenaria]WAQ95814.1 hypothetical protein MAR_028504 [Mya arenaria]
MKDKKGFLSSVDLTAADLGIDMASEIVGSVDSKCTVSNYCPFSSPAPGVQGVTPAGHPAVQGEITPADHSS